MNFLERVEQLRVKKGLSVGEVNRLVGLTASNKTAIKNGIHNAGLKMLRRLADEESKAGIVIDKNESIENTARIQYPQNEARAQMLVKEPSPGDIINVKPGLNPLLYREERKEGTTVDTLVRMRTRVIKHLNELDELILRLSGEGE